MRLGEIKTDIVENGLLVNIDLANRSCYNRNELTVTETVNNGVGTLSGATGTNNTPQFDSNNFGSLDFDGVDDIINFGNLSTANFGTNVPFTISAWFKGESLTDSYSNVYGIISKFAYNDRSGWSFALRGGSQYGFLFRSGYDAGTESTVMDVSPTEETSQISNLYNNGWHNVTITQDSSRNAIVYIDYVNTFTRTYEPNHANSSSYRFQIGSYSNSGGYFLGKIANAHIYNRALSAQEVLHNYNALRSRFGV